MALGISDVPAIDVHACRRFEGDIVDAMYAAVTENRNVSLLVDSLTYLLNLGYLRVGPVVRAAKEGLALFAFVDSYHGPSEVIVNGSGLAWMPDAADDRVGFVLWHLEKIHCESVFARNERVSRDGPRQTYEFL